MRSGLRDPFDRLLVAQTLEGSYTLDTHDDVFEAYGVAILRASPKRSRATTLPGVDGTHRGSDYLVADCRRRACAIHLPGACEPADAAGLSTSTPSFFVLLMVNTSVRLSAAPVASRNRDALPTFESSCKPRA